jgi:cysteine desulfurase
MKENTVLVSIMAVNNEIGVVQNLAEIGKLTRKKKIFFHTDAAQGVGKIGIDVNAMNIDLLSISGHKVYGPKGIGALYVRRTGGKRVRLRPIIDGGGQERGLRSGTLPVSLVVGLGEACRLAKVEISRDNAHVEKLSQRLYTKVMKELPKVTVNGSLTQRYMGNMNMSFACVEGESLLMALASDVSVSSGSACTSASLEPSYVLRAIGLNEELAHTSLRFGLGRFSTEADVDRLVEKLVKEVRRLRELSPLWEMETEGSSGKIQWS